MLMKDAFELESHRHCKTVVFANVAPSVVDLAMTTNTLRYATPLRIGQSQRQKIVPHPDNPAGVNFMNILRAHFSYKCFVQLFSNYSLALQFFWERIFVLKLCVKC